MMASGLRAAAAAAAAAIGERVMAKTHKAKKVPGTRTVDATRDRAGDGALDMAIDTSAEHAERAALPRVHEVHTDPERAGPCEETLPRALKQSAEDKSAARWAYERLILYIQNFEKQLDNSHEVAMGFTGGAKMQLIQHVTQLSVMLRALPKHVDQAEPNRIGFRLGREIEEAEAPPESPSGTTGT